MQLQTILKRCKKRKFFRICNIGDNRYLTDGYVSVCMNMLAPDWNVEDCLIAMEIDEDSRSNYTVYEEEEKSPLEVTDLSQIERLEFSLNVDGKAIQPFLLPDGRIMFVDMDLLAVFKDEIHKDYYCRAELEHTVLYISVDDFIIGMAAPTKVRLGAIKNFCELTKSGVIASEKADFYDSERQIQFDV